MSDAFELLLLLWAFGAVITLIWVCHRLYVTRTERDELQTLEAQLARQQEAIRRRAMH